MFVLWKGHVDNGLDGNWVGLKAIGGNDVAHEHCFLHKELHFAEVKLHVVLFEALKYGNEVAVMVDSGFLICSATSWDQDVIGDADDLEAFQDHMDSALPLF